ncbi:A disintegrin and metalloproteinase with thrombospondin motifs like [Ornithodoros turicata]|uniref:A disintegrin and metalloproteinase with thrombospondin motifs like n=1 Tax=Ornithodoros turicata TaxID=34597 RepID=UPI003139E682
MKFHNDSDNLMDSYDSLFNLAGYAVARKDAFSSYDLVVLVTGRDLVSVYSDGRFSSGTAGRAFVGKVCDERYKVGAVEDLPPTYDGVHTFVHEVGHLMGCVHDGARADSSITNHPGAENCPGAEKFIMSTSVAFNSQDKFSYCCGQQIHVVYHLEATACLKRETTSSIINSTQLPGDLLLNADQYCKYEHPEYNKTAKNMPNLGNLSQCVIACELIQGNLRMHLHKSPDGIPCEDGTGKVCINKECVDYTSPTPAQ